MHLTSWLRKEKSGLAYTTLELVEATEKLGHPVCIRQPSDGMPIWHPSEETDLHLIHSQLHPNYYTDGKPKLMWQHGEPLSSVGNGISMKAIVDLAPVVDALICMRKEEWPIWNAIKRTYYVPKGINLEKYRPLEGIVERLSGEPAVLYVESWRGQRNPLYLLMAMQEVHKKFPKARFHLYNCTDKKMYETFKALIDHCKMGTFVRSLQGPVDDVTLLINRVDIVVSALSPLYARTPLEALACGKAAICHGYNEPDYPWTVTDYSPAAFADTIIRCWEDYGKIDYRKYAEEHHDVMEMARQAIEVYKRFL